MIKKFYALGLSSLVLLSSCGGGGGSSTDSNISGISDNTGSSTQVITQTGYAVDDVLNGTVKVYYFPSYDYIFPNDNPVATGQVVNGEFQIQIPQKQGVWVACIEGTDGTNTFTQNNPLCGVFDFTGNAWFVNPLTDFIYSFYNSGQFFPLSDLKNFLSQKLNTVYKDSAIDLNDAIQYVTNLKQNLGIVNSSEWEWKLAIFKNTEISLPSKFGGFLMAFNSQVEITHTSLTDANNIPAKGVENPISYGCGDFTNNYICSDNVYISPDGEFAISSSLASDVVGIYVKTNSNNGSYSHIRISKKDIIFALQNYYGVPCLLPDGQNSVYIDNTRSYLTNCDFSFLKTNGYVECQYVAKLGAGLLIYYSDQPPPTCNLSELNLTNGLDLTTLENSYLIGTVRIKLTEEFTSN